MDEPTAPKSHAPRRRRPPVPRGAWFVVGAVLLLGLVAFAGFGWYVSGSIAEGALHVRVGEREYGLEVVAASATDVTLRHEGDSNWLRPGLWGLEWREDGGGYSRVGAILEVDEDEGIVRRALAPGSSPPPVGVRARLDNFAVSPDPSTLGLEFQDLTFNAEDVELPAWYVPGEGSTWAILVHGKGASRAEAMRLLPTLAGRGLPALVIAYRNDPDVPTETSQYAYGATEWADLESAVTLALSRGAQDIVLVGYSMGGAIVLQFLAQSGLAEHVRALILDAPMLDLRSIALHELGEAGIPGFLRWWPLWVTQQRYGLDWDAIDYLPPPVALTMPVLLFHGDADTVIPVRLSDELAAMYPETVEYHRIPDAHHVGAWNLDPERYEGAVRDFLQRVLGD